MKLSSGVWEASRSVTAKAVAKSERTCRVKALARTSSPQRRIATSTARASRVACEAASPLMTFRCRTSSCDTSEANQARTRFEG
eukprot:12289417-Heterocapsa_arctica.AAC.1